MRHDHYSPPSKYWKEFRRALKLSHQHFAVYAYLEGGPESHQTGLYCIAPVTIGAAMMLPEDEVVRIMEDLQRVGLLHWDAETDMVWLPCVATEQFRWKEGTGAERDNKTKGARKHVSMLPHSHLVEWFLDAWPVFRGSTECTDEGASKGLRRDSLSSSSYSSSSSCPPTAPGHFTCTSQGELP